MRSLSYKYFFISILILFVFISGCTKQTEEEFNQTESETNQTSQSQKYCGDGVCDGPETPENCPEDCGGGTSKVENRTRQNKPTEMTKSYCGDGICSKDENVEICPKDCCEEGHITTSGHVYCNETWSGDIHITGDVWVHKGVTLTIEPGTNILIRAQHDENNLFENMGVVRFNCSEVPCNWMMQGPEDLSEEKLISIKIEGKLIAKGRPDAWIHIHSDAENPTPWDWWGIGAMDVEIEYLNISNYLHFSHPKYNSSIRNSYFTMTRECPICLEEENENVVIEHNQIERTGGEMINTNNGGNGPTIRYNVFGPGVEADRGFKTNAIVVSGTFPTIEYNIFKKGTGIAFAETWGHAGGTVKYNLFEEDTFLLLMCGTPIIKYNNIYGEIILPIQCPDVPVINLSYNYWGTTNISEIKSRINGMYLPPQREVILDPILTEPVDVDEENIGIER